MQSGYPKKPKYSIAERTGQAALLPFYPALYLFFETSGMEEPTTSKLIAGFSLTVLTFLVGIPFTVPAAVLGCGYGLYEHGSFFVNSPYPSIKHEVKPSTLKPSP